MKKIMIINLFITLSLFLYFGVESLISIPVSMRNIMSIIDSIVLFLQTILYVVLFKKLKDNNKQ